MFEAAHRDNKDEVKFFNLNAWIGEGNKDVSGDADQFATVTGIIHYEKFGRLSQIYTLRLDKIFIYSGAASGSSNVMR